MTKSVTSDEQYTGPGATMLADRLAEQAHAVIVNARPDWIADGPQFSVHVVLTDPDGRPHIGSLTGWPYTKAAIARALANALFHDVAFASAAAKAEAGRTETDTLQ